MHLAALAFPNGQHQQWQRDGTIKEFKHLKEKILKKFVNIKNK